MSKKDKKQAKKTGKSPLALVQEILGVIGGIVGSVMAIYGFIKTFRDDADGLSWLMVLGGIIWIIVLWNMFQRQKTYAYILLALTIVGGAAGWVGWQSQTQAKEDKVIILIAKFDGPEEKYGIRDQIFEALSDELVSEKYLEIISSNETITSSGGKEAAIKLGVNNSADIVIWAWYRPTENPNINIHFENLTKKNYDIVNTSETRQPTSTLAELESFSLQKKLGSEVNNLVIFLKGYIYFNLGDNYKAAQYFEKVVESPQFTPLIGKENIYLLSAYAHTNIGEYDKALEEFNKVIEITPNSFFGYNGRGTVYVSLGQLEDAMSDFNQAIKLNPSSVLDYVNQGVVYHYKGMDDYAISSINKAIDLDPEYLNAYLDRGAIYSDIGSFELAILDFNKAVQLEPNSAIAYNGLGFAYDNLNQYKLAISQYDKALEISPNFAEAYCNRGIVYIHLNQHERAIQDFNQAIKLDPNNFIFYNSRGVSNGALGKYIQAIDDYSYGIQLNPNYALLYLNRGSTYKEIGKTAEAEADFAKYKELTGKDAP